MKAIFTLSALFVALVSMAQVGVNTATPDPSSMLDVVSANKGMLVPRVNLSNVNVTMLDGMNTAASGLLIYNTNGTTVGGNGIGFYYFNGTVWTPLAVAATDDQNLTTPTLTGTTLNLGIENGTGTSINLASLQDGTGTDNQTIDNFSLVGTTLRLSLEDDGQVPQTVNLASLQDGTGTDDQNLTTATLTGTTLNLGIENGTGTSINLASLQDGTGTDDQNLTTATLTGTTLNLGIENGSGTSVNLASLRDHDFYEVGGTNSPNAIGDNIYTQGRTHFGSNTAASGTVEITTADNVPSLVIDNSSPLGSTGIEISSSGQYKIGVDMNFSGINNNASMFIYTLDNQSFSMPIAHGIYQQFNGSGLGYTGLRNWFTPTSNYTGVLTGVHNAFHSDNNGMHIGTETSISGIGTGQKYGERIYIDPVAGGQHYGIHSQVTKASGFAGYFLGRVSIGALTTNNYILPISRGTNGQVMQTDGAGNVSWTTPIASSDDQNLTTASLTGTTLSLGIENGSGTSVNLASLQDGTGTDDQNLTTATLTGTTLNLGIESGTGTSVNLAPILNNVSANNGLNVDAGTIQMGGALIENTIVPFGAFTLDYNLSGLGDFVIQDNGVDKFSFNDDGTTFAGGDMYWKQTNTAGANVARMYASADDGVFDTYQAGVVANRIHSNGSSFFNGGNVAFGKTVPAYLVDISETTATAARGVSVLKTDNIATDSHGVYITKISAGSGRSHAIYTDVSGAGAGQKYGIFNELNSAALGSQYAVRNWIRSATADQVFGVFNNLDNAGTGDQYGIYNGMRSTGSSQIRGVHNEFDTGVVATELTGVRNQISAGTPGIGGFNGIFNNFLNPANGTFYGTRTEFSTVATGTGTKYGTYNLISSAAGGTHYGTYNNIDVNNGWAGYFVGRNYISDRLSIGNNNNANAALNIQKNSTGTYAHIELDESVANDGSRVKFTNAGESTNHWVLYGRADNTDADNDFNIYSTVGGNVLQLEGEGRVGVMRSPATNALEVNGNASKNVAGSWLANSDARLKKDIETIEPEKALEKLLSLRGVTYKWNDDKTGIQRPESIQYGFVAQEIQQVFPEKVEADAQGYLQTAYGDYDALMVQSMKAILERVEKLEAENAELRAMIRRQSTESASAAR